MVKKESEPMKKAVVLLSGGLDSTTTLAYAIDKGYDVVPLTVSYGQRHEKELRSARAVAEHYHVHRHVITNVDLSFLRSSALTSKDIDVPMHDTAECIGKEDPGHVCTS